MSKNLFLDEGYIKYNCHWKKTTKAITYKNLHELNKWRNIMYDLKLIGYYKEHKVGYGNISVRYEDSKQILISGTQTGHLLSLDPEHYALITKFDIDKNELFCTGPIKASSEALTHAVLYQLDPSCNAVIHIHNLALWKSLMNKIPTSNPDIPYGTPEMAYEMMRLYRESDLPERKLMVMGGHDEGIIAFGKDLKEAGDIILELL